jgi:hypothetical protein
VQDFRDESSINAAGHNMSRRRSTKGGYAFSDENNKADIVMSRQNN